MNILAIFIGGIIGGMLRYILGLIIPEPNQFPLDILIINLTGSLALGSPQHRSTDPNATLAEKRPWYGHHRIVHDFFHILHGSHFASAIPRAPGADLCPSQWRNGSAARIRR